MTKVGSWVNGRGVVPMGVVFSFTRKNNWSYWLTCSDLYKARLWIAVEAAAFTFHLSCAPTVRSLLPEAAPPGDGFSKITTQNLPDSSRSASQVT